MINQSRDKNGKFIARDNEECVPVPKKWLSRLLQVGKNTVVTVSDVCYLKGYIESPESFIKPQ